MFVEKIRIDCGPNLFGMRSSTNISVTFPAQAAHDGRPNEAATPGDLNLAIMVHDFRCQGSREKEQ
jgi:hypothetical protein